MPAPDSTVEEVRTSVLRYMRMYEEGQITLGDLVAEMAVMSPAYEHAMGAIEDHYREVLRAASTTEGGQLATHDFEQALTKFRRAEAAWS